MSRRPLTETEIAAIQAIVAARKAGALYQILGLSPGASADQVDVAYKTYVREWHPDRFYTRDTGELGLAIEENFVEATQAWRTLKDPGKRAAWHREKGVPDVKTPTIPPVAPRVGTLPPVPPSHVVDPSKIVRKAEPPPPPAPPPKPRPQIGRAHV